MAAAVETRPAPTGNTRSFSYERMQKQLLNRITAGLQLDVPVLLNMPRELAGTEFIQDQLALQVFASVTAVSKDSKTETEIDVKDKLDVCSLEFDPEFSLANTSYLPVRTRTWKDLKSKFIMPHLLIFQFTMDLIYL